MRAVVAGALLAGAACASAAKGSRCVPIDPELYLEYGGLYDECTVDSPARVVFRPRIEINYSPPRNVICSFAELKGIVDTTGRLILESVQVGRTNDGQYVELVLAQIGQFRFSPGRTKDGRAVHQITRFESKTPVRSPLTSQGEAPRPSSTAC